MRDILNARILSPTVNLFCGPTSLLHWDAWVMGRWVWEGFLLSMVVVPSLSSLPSPWWIWWENCAFSEGWNQSGYYFHHWYKWWDGLYISWKISCRLQDNLLLWSQGYVINFHLGFHNLGSHGTGICLGCFPHSHSSHHRGLLGLLQDRQRFWPVEILRAI